MFKHRHSVIVIFVNNNKYNSAHNYILVCNKLFTAYKRLNQGT